MGKIIHKDLYILICKAADAPVHLFGKFGVINVEVESDGKKYLFDTLLHLDKDNHDNISPGDKVLVRIAEKIWKTEIGKIIYKTQTTLTGRAADAPVHLFSKFGVINVEVESDGKKYLFGTLIDLDRKTSPGDKVIVGIAEGWGQRLEA